MQKKTYMKPLVCLYAIEASTILADSTKPSTPPSPKPVQSPGFQVDESITSGDGDDVWE